MWDSDNAIFNVNGSGIERLIATLKLANEKTFIGYRYSENKGLVLYQYDSSNKSNPMTKFLTPHTAEQVAQIVFEWLKSEEAKKIPCKGWDANADHDGSNEKGWRVYTEDWGHVDGHWNCLIVVPAYMWYGK